MKNEKNFQFNFPSLSMRKSGAKKKKRILSIWKQNTMKKDAGEFIQSGFRIRKKK